MTVQALIQQLSRFSPLMGVYVAVPDSEHPGLSTRTDIDGTALTPGGRVLILLEPCRQIEADSD